MKWLFLCLLMMAFVISSGCAEDTSEIDNNEMKSNGTAAEAGVRSTEAEIASGDRVYPAYVAAPSTDSKKPAIVLIHSFRGLEKGYLELTDMLASEGYVVIAPEWQTFETSPADEVVEQLIRDSLVHLGTRSDVDTSSLGLTGFCAGGRYTMLFLPSTEDFRSGVAWYGFPYSGGSEGRPYSPADMIEQLDTPMLIIHGTDDQASNIDDIYRYSTELDTADKYFELKVYQGQPHGFMLEDGNLSRSFESMDAYWQMVTFFDRTLK